MYQEPDSVCRKRTLPQLQINPCTGTAPAGRLHRQSSNHATLRAIDPVVL